MVGHFILSRPHCTLRLQSKTDQLGKGCTLVIARTGTPTCSCAILLRYAALAKRNLDSLEFVFQNLSFSTSEGYSLRSSTSLSNTRAREVVLAKFCAVGIDTLCIGLHSLRIGVPWRRPTAEFLITSLKTTAGGNLTLPRNYIAGKVSNDSFLLLHA